MCAFLDFSLVVFTSFLFFSFNGVEAHMRISNPYPRGNAVPPIGVPDYSLTEPLNDQYRPFPCGGKPKGAVQATFAQGQDFSMTIEGTAFHNGGHCQWALSRDDGTSREDLFIVFRTLLDNCIPSVGPLTYNLRIPENYPPGPATLAWTWINSIGNREYYMNCVDITVTGSSETAIQNVFEGPKLLVVNLEGYPRIGEFGNGANADPGYSLFSSRENVNVGKGNVPVTSWTSGTSSVTSVTTSVSTGSSTGSSSGSSVTVPGETSVSSTFVSSGTVVSVVTIFENCTEAS